MLVAGQEHDAPTVKSKTTVTTVTTEMTTVPRVPSDKLRENISQHRDAEPGQVLTKEVETPDIPQTSIPYRAPELDGVPLYHEVKEPAETKLDVQQKEHKEKTDESSRFLTAPDEESIPYKAPDLEGISLLREEEQPAEVEKGTMRTTTVTTVVTEIVQPEEEPTEDVGETKFEDSVPKAITAEEEPTTDTVTTTKEDVKQPEEVTRDAFRGKDEPIPYRPPDLEGISLYKPEDEARPVGVKGHTVTTTTVTRVITEREEDATPEETSQDSADFSIAAPDEVQERPQPTKNEPTTDTFGGTDFSHPYKAPDLEGVQLFVSEKDGGGEAAVSADVKEPSKRSTQITETPIPYKAPKLDDISLVSEKSTVIVEEEEPEEEEEPPTETDTFKGDDGKGPSYRAPKLDDITLYREDKTPAKEKTEVRFEEQQEPDKKTATVITTTETFYEDESRRYHPPELNDVKLYREQPEDIPKTPAEEPSPEDPHTEERDTFKGNADISIGYKAPELEAISLYVEEEKKPEESTVTATTVVTKTVQITTEGDDEVQVQPAEEERGTFRGNADISIPYKAPALEGISLQVQKTTEPEETTKTTVTEILTQHEDNKPEPTEEEPDKFEGTDISIGYNAPELEEVSLFVKEKEPEESTVTTTTTVVTVTKVCTEHDDKEPAEVDEKDDNREGPGDQEEPKQTEAHDRSEQLPDIPQQSISYKPPGLNDVSLYVRRKEDNEKNEGESKEQQPEIPQTSTPYKPPHLVEVPLYRPNNEEEDTKTTTTTVTTITTKVQEEVPEGEEEPMRKVSFREIPADVHMPYKAPSLEDIQLYIPGETGEDRKTTETVTTTTTEISRVVSDQQPEERDTFRGSDISIPYKAPELSSVDLSLKERQEEPSAETTTRVKETIIVTRKEPEETIEEPGADENQNITLTTETALITNIDGETQVKETVKAEPEPVEQSQEEEEPQRQVEKSSEEGDEEWTETGESFTKTKTVITKMTTTKGGTPKRKRRAVGERKHSDDILGDDEWSDTDEISVNTETVTTIVKASDEGEANRETAKPKAEKQEGWSERGDSYSTTESVKTVVTTVDREDGAPSAVLDKPKSDVDDMKEKDESWSDSWSTTKTVKTVVTTVDSESQPGRQTQTVTEVDQGQGDQEWFDSGEVTTKTQTVTTVVTRSADSHSARDQRVISVSADAERTSPLDDTTEVTHGTTVVERGAHMVPANQVRSPFVSFVSCHKSMLSRPGVAQNQNYGTQTKFYVRNV